MAYENVQPLAYRLSGEGWLEDVGVDPEPVLTVF